MSETIAAIATARGRAGIAVIRVSGADAWAIAERLTGRPVEAGRFSVRKVVSKDSFLDEALVLCFKGPNSYTGEDAVEFQCHGGTVTPQRVLEACLTAGARLARRGEFTERAFLNGKIDYDQAESVLDLIDAKTTRAADAALEGLSGRRCREYRELYESALVISTDMEHALDIDEGVLGVSFAQGLTAKVAMLRCKLESAVRKFREGKILRKGALVVLAGPPNAGKSSLMNALLEENRAIVSDVPGTTRDSIEEWLDVEGWPVRLVDTAGLRETGDAIEAEGVRRSERLIAQADLVLGLDCDAGVRIHSKCDLGRGEGLNVSAKTGEGLDALKRLIAERLALCGGLTAEDVEHADEARLAPLVAALECLPRSCDDLVLAGNAMRRTCEKLGSLVGATYSSDLLDSLFSRFCVGK